jgi:hypothetical protein
MARPGVDVRGQKARGGIGSHTRPNEGATVEWYTPAGIFEALGVFFDLDPCAPKRGVNCPARQWCNRAYERRQDGLSQPWRGRVWLNPPYGPQTELWMRRLAAHGDGIALVFARTETRWWHETVRAASAVCFIAGRLTFVAEDGLPSPYNSGGPSALVAYGQECAEAVASAGLGMTFGVNATALRGQGQLWEAPCEG